MLTLFLFSAQQQFWSFSYCYIFLSGVCDVGWSEYWLVCLILETGKLLGGDSISWLIPGKSDHFLLLSQDRQAAGSMANRNLIKAKGRSGPELWWRWCSTVRIGTDPELQSYSRKSVKTVSIKNWPLPLCDFQLQNWRSSALRCKIQIGGHCLGRDLPCEGIVSGKSYFQTVQRLSIHFYITRLGSRIPPFVNSIPQVLSNPLTAWIHLSWTWPRSWSRMPFTRLNHPLRLGTGNDITVHQKDFFWIWSIPHKIPSMLQDPGSLWLTYQVFNGLKDCLCCSFGQPHPVLS